MRRDGLDPYEALANAVVLQAVNDYRDAVKKLSCGRKNVAAQAMKEECESFFKSSYFNQFTELDGNTLLSRLEKEASE